MNMYDPNVSVGDLRASEGLKKARYEHTAALREVYDRAFYVALTGICVNGTRYVGIVESADAVALESVRTHAARMAELERVIAERTEA